MMPSNRQVMWGAVPPQAQELGNEAGRSVRRGHCCPVPADHGFNVCNRRFQSLQGLIVHPQVSHEDAIRDGNLVNVQEAQRLACDMADAVVVPRIGELIDENDGSAGARDCGNAVSNAGNLLCGCFGLVVGHDRISPAIFDRMVGAVETVMERRLAGELGPNWPFVRFLAEAVVKTCLAELGLVREARAFPVLNP